MPDFDIAKAEFERQASVLRGLVRAIDAVSSLADNATADGVVLPTIPAEGQNTMAAAAIVLLAAHFEEYVRQQIEEYAKAIVAEYDHLQAEFRIKFLDSYWRAGAGRIGRIRPSAGDAQWNARAEGLLSSMISYPVRGDIALFSANFISEHETNMRWDMILDLSARVGVKKLSELLYKNAALKKKLGASRKDTMSADLRARMNNFYSLRNEIVHSIAQSSGVGFTIFDEWVEFFLAFSNAFAEALVLSNNEFVSKVEIEKQKLAV